MKTRILFIAVVLIATTCLLAAKFFFPKCTLVAASLNGYSIVESGDSICPLQNDVNFYLRWRCSQASYVKAANVPTYAIDPGRVSVSNFEEVQTSIGDLSLMKKLMAMVDTQEEISKR
jgi:hypothetical protein